MFNMNDMLEKAKEESSRVEKIAEDRHVDIMLQLNDIQDQLIKMNIYLESIINTWIVDMKKREGENKGGKN